MGYLGRQDANDLLYQLNQKSLRIGVPPFAKVENLTVRSGALLPAFESLVVKASGTSILGTVVGSSKWEGSGIAEAYGGTGQVSYTAGDILFALDGTTLNKLPVGTTGQSLIVGGGGFPAWGAPGSGAVDNVVITGQSVYTAQDADRFIMASGQVQVNLPSSPVVGQKHTIKDVAGVAASSGVTVSGVAGLIDGAATSTLVNNYEAASFVWHGTAWAVY